ncbi:PLP-dependent aminotransferase family protein [Chryseobacterium sp. NKUCC03_KSP]|uniref:aminotransferase-like domain-containing protein n=1 Tax=Chryseobacterium sp. NKUCC03_KSP TaxID=2842125 RepID=UPI001C5B607C|nr:PLP-dependent aminotransferase family protein [Chryseobacterium sp. NKUCC03_KSP]MBW3523862.1 PLP-dependent aminotransferase family protein [Chryseobacterium sp. NKUCC03_KSP]
MEYFKGLIPIDKSSKVPVYLQITNAFIHQIRNGRLRKGLKLPGSRKLGSLLNINRMTVVAAYDELQAQGWIDQKAKTGSFVRDELPELMPKPITETDELLMLPNEIPFAVNNNLIQFPYFTSTQNKLLTIDDGFPDLRLTPIEELSRNLRGLSKVSGYKKHLFYGDTKGNLALREILAEFLNDTRGLPVTTNNLLIIRGATMGLYLTARVITQAGDNVIMSEPGFIFVRELMEQLQLNIHYVPVDENGLDVDAVERICKTKQIKFIYTVPHHHYPTTVTLPPERRIQLLELANTYNFAIIEDDYDYDFHYASTPMMPMASIDQHGSVVYIGTLTKTLAPSIRIGFLTATEKFVDLVTSYRKSIDFQGDTFMELAIASLYQDRTIEKHIKKSVKIYRSRRDYFCELLKDQLGDKISFDIPDGGMSVWTKFHDIDLKKLNERTIKKDLKINFGKYYGATELVPNNTRMGFASLNFEEQEKIVEILKSCI